MTITTKDELRLTEVDVSAAITALVAAMVDNDRRHRGDCDAVMAAVGSSARWDGPSIYGVAEGVGIPLALVGIIGLPAIRDAYAAAWRAAVEADLAARAIADDGGDDAA